MQAGLQAHIAFHLGGPRPSGELDEVGDLGLRPALLARYRDPGKLRYDFPLVLIHGGAGEASVQPLSALFDRAIKDIAKGADAGRLQRHALRLEGEIRALAAERSRAFSSSAGPEMRGSLTELWEAAADRLNVSGDELFRDSLNRLRAVIKTDGDVVDCDRAMPFRLCHHAWKTVHDGKARRFKETIGKLVTKLSDILRADFVHSPAGLSAERLEACVGTPHRDVFDFEALSRLLTRTASNAVLSESRRARIRWLLSVLESQRFFPPLTESEENAEPYGFVFESCADAVGAYRDRLPKKIELAKAIAMAGLEIEGEYREARHDAFFASFGDSGLDSRDYDLFPDYLICSHAEDMRPGDTDAILEAFSAGLRAKVLVQTDDILEPSPIAGGNLVLGLRSRQLANAVIGLSGFYVLQSPSSNLPRFRERIFRGLTYPGPALFSVYSGAGGNDLPPYLNAAAAMESRAFPAFTYDPSAGPDWASRFYLAGNPQVERDWPVYDFAYEDEEHQRLSEPLAFTLADFVACDRRYAKHFARIPRGKWNGSMAAVSEFLAPEPAGLSQKVPCLLMVDGEDVLQKVIVDERLVREARRCAEMWRSLQELAGFHSSHAARLLARERKAWTEQARQETAARANGHAAPEAVPPAAAPVPVPGAQASPPALPEPAEAEKSAADPYIETARCTTCNECTQINGKMFVYDANKQAFIADPDAGTYRQLVEAAEGCQVSVIHPGQPRNPDEPDLDELKKRAGPFL